MPWELPDGTGGSRAVVIVRDMPRVWNAYHDSVTFEIDLPPGVNAQGPLVYRPALRELGQQSAMRYRAALGLCWMWDRYGAHNGRYIQPTRPRLARDEHDRILDAEGTIFVGKDGQPVRTYTVQKRQKGKLTRIARPGIVPLDESGQPVPLSAAAQERNPAADRYPILTPAQLVELLVLAYSDGRTDRSPELSHDEAERMIEDLHEQTPAAARKGAAYAG